MKRIIAAALSILVGAFGYTIVDSAIEDRVATLESEVVELREEVSRYHPQNTTSPYEGSEVHTTEIQYYTTTVQSSEGYTEIKVGDYLTESSNSQHKFLLRKWASGRIQYISPSNYQPSTKVHTYPTTQGPTTTRQELYSNAVRAPEITDPADGRLETTASLTNSEVVTREPGYTVIDEGTTTALTYEDYFLYITDVSAKITAIEEDVSYSYGYDKNYSLVSNVYDKTKTVVTIKYKGYTDPVLAGKKVDFNTSVMYIEEWNSYNSISFDSTIKPDGSFEFEEQLFFYNAYLILENYGDVPSFNIRSVSVGESACNATTTKKMTTTTKCLTTVPETQLPTTTQINY